MIRTRHVVVAGAALVAAAALFWPRPAQVTVAPGEPLQDALDAAPSGATVVLEPGVHRGPVTIATTVDLQGRPGAVVSAPRDAEAAISIRADGVRLSGLQVEGGSTGVLVREVNGAVIDGVTVAGAELHGIEVVDGSARITASVVDGLLHPMAQGIEVRNSDGRPDTVIQGVEVTGGQEGIVSHVSEVQVRDSTVAETTLRGITITEMSDGVVTGNRVTSAAGAGLYCGDMSRCAFANNSAMDVAATAGGRSAAGWGLVVTFHASAWSKDNDLGGDAGPVMTSIGSHMRARSPLDPASPGDLLVPLGRAVLVALVVGAIGYLLGRLFRMRRAPLPAFLGARGAAAAFFLALVVQTFHMVEHYLQVYRIHVDHIPSRGGLLGPSVETEWVHLAYNGALLFLLIVVLFELRRMTRDARLGFVGGAGLIQGWHAVEHVAKIAQHITSGAKVNPGLIGGQFDLVWFHFTINLIVYGLCLAAAVVWLRTRRRSTTALTYEPVPA